MMPDMLAGQQAPPAGTKQAASCLHLPVPRVLLITVVFALMAIPLLLFTAGRVQVYTPCSPEKDYVHKSLTPGSLAMQIN